MSDKNEPSFAPTSLDDDLLAAADLETGGVNTAATTESAVKEVPKKGDRKPFEVNIGVLLGGIVTFVVIILTAIFIINGGKNRDSDRRARAGSQQTENQYALEMNDLRTSVGALRTELEASRQEFKSYKTLMNQRLADSGSNNIERRIVDGEAALQIVRNEVHTLSRRIADARPLADNLKQEMSARILSIGNGLATVADEEGREHTLRKGDRWNGKRVQAIRPDLQQIILSDGSVIL